MQSASITTKIVNLIPALYHDVYIATTSRDKVFHLHALVVQVGFSGFPYQKKIECHDITDKMLNINNSNTKYVAVKLYLLPSFTPF